MTADHKQILSDSKDHKKIIEKGPPEDVPNGIKDVQLPLPQEPLSGMVNKFGSRVRLHFKTELEQLWLGTKGSTC